MKKLTKDEKKKVIYKVVMDLRDKGIIIDYASSLFLQKTRKMSSINEENK